MNAVAPSLVPLVTRATAAALAVQAATTRLIEANRRVLGACESREVKALLPTDSHVADALARSGRAAAHRQTLVATLERLYAVALEHGARPRP
jgi:hypothetical protein